jgi:hypothetical protein
MSWAGLYCVLAGTCEGGVGDRELEDLRCGRCMTYWDGTTGDTALMILRMEVDFPVLRLFVKWDRYAWQLNPHCMKATRRNESNLVAKTR